MSCVKLHPIQIKQLSQGGASKFDTINWEKKKKLRPSVWNFAKLKNVFAWKIEKKIFHFDASLQFHKSDRNTRGATKHFKIRFYHDCL